MVRAEVAVRVACWLMHGGPKARNHYIAINTIASSPNTTSIYLRVKVLYKKKINTVLEQLFKYFLLVFFL